MSWSFVVFFCFFLPDSRWLSSETVGFVVVNGRSVRDATTCRLSGQNVRTGFASEKKANNQNAV